MLNKKNYEWYTYIYLIIKTCNSAKVLGKYFFIWNNNQQELNLRIT